MTIEDIIGMTSLALSPLFSPDHEKVILVLRRGDLQHNSNVFSLLMWHSGNIFSSPKATLLLERASSSNRDAIEAVRWLADNETIAFLGEAPGETHQVYFLNVRTGLVKKVTSHPTNVTSYSVTPNGKEIAYTAAEPVGDIFEKSIARTGFIVTSEWLPDLMLRRRGGDGFAAHPQLFFQDSTGHVRRLPVAGKLWPRAQTGVPVLSPNGEYVAISSATAEIPRLWKEYTDPKLHEWTRQVVASGQYSYLEQYDLLNTRTGDRRVLLNAPIGYGNSEAVWLPDSKSVVITNTFLPLDSASDTERRSRESIAYVIEVSVSTGRFTTITHDDLVLRELDPHTGELRFLVGRFGTARSRPERAQEVGFRKVGAVWRKQVGPPGDKNRLRLTMEQGMNMPPRLVAEEPGRGGGVSLLDLNPQLHQLRLANVEQIKWEDSTGQEFVGGLYYPVDYIKGNRYPLVLQTHGWDPGQFWIDGPAPTAFAAQALAGQGIMVLQADEEYITDANTLKEVEREVSRLESAVDNLAGRGIVDPTRVGIVGFSRSCDFVKHALIRSKIHFAAASVTDGVDGGYFQYLLFANSLPGYTQLYEGENGGLPFGAGLKSWAERSSSFQIDRVQAPLLITAERPEVLLFEWEWFAALRRLRKPVEMVYMPDGAHVLQRPWDRMISQQATVDWFRFWLTGEEDPDPAKAAQYVRWRELRKLQQR